MEFESEKYRERWVGYFDLLGVREMTRNGSISEIFYAYREAIAHLETWKKRNYDISHAWFSDSFIIYSSRLLLRSIAEIELVSRWFMFHLLSRKIPVRGALACEKLYADKEKNLYLGEALLEAYEYAENQNWIGLVLCPSSLKYFKYFPVRERSHYVEYKIPFKKSMKIKTPMACFLGNWIRKPDGENLLLKYLKEMESVQKEKTIALKYKRTIHFIEKQENERKKNT